MGSEKHVYFESIDAIKTFGVRFITPVKCKTIMEFL